MSFVPRHNYPLGTEVTLFTQKMVLNGKTEDGYELTNAETGETDVMSFSKFVEYQKSSAMKISNVGGISTSAIELRLGGLTVAEQLSKPQQEIGKFHYALCCGMEALRKKRKLVMGDKGLDLSIRTLNNAENQEFIRLVAEQVFGQKINCGRVRGGRNAEWVMYQGRTLIKYLKIFYSLAPHDDVVAALATLDHLKGNEIKRLKLRLREMMTQAWEEIGLDLKGTSVANVHKQLQMLVHEENARRQRNDLAPLMVPSEKTLSAHRNELLSPTEYLIATKGERYARNKRGRGSTDYRALMPGELVEIDECKASLVTSAKECGTWARLGKDDRKVLEKIDTEIRKRLSILVMIDVASRMPLAWIVSDQPRTEATLALLRMATRDKTREKTIYGCDGDPAVAMGLGMVKNDNGVGLRNAAVKQALLGVGAASTDVRTYASTDKPYVERILGTTESILLKLIHGYTGRKAGELPRYDAKANGILDIDELYGILTRFFIDEYPSMRHMGVGMGGGRPAEVLKKLNEDRGLFRPLDEDVRRIHLGWKLDVTPSDEGVRVFSGLWYNSVELQRAVDRPTATGKVSVFVDPDNVTEATVLITGHREAIRVRLQITALAELPLPQALDVVLAHRKEDPSITKIYNDRLAKMRRQLYDQLKAIGVERRLPRSYSTFEECQRKAIAVFAGASFERSIAITDTVRPGELSDATMGSGIFPIEGSGTLIEHQPSTMDPAGPDDFATISVGETPNEVSRQSQKSRNTNAKLINGAKSPLGRPKTPGGFL